MSLQILIIEPNEIFTNFMRENSDYDVLNQEKLNLLSMNESDILIVDGQAFELNTLLQKKEYFNEYQYVFYVGQVTKEDAVLAKINDIIPIETDDPAHVLSVLENLIASEKNNRVFSFLAADRKAGNTSIIHSTADSLTEVSTKEILVISLNNNLSEPLYVDSTLDQLKTSILSHRLTFDEILNTAKFNGKYLYIGANKNIFDFSKYTAEQIFHFYKVLLEQDTHLILLDLGSDAQNPYHAVAFDHIHHAFLITKPNASYQYVFKNKVEQIFEPYYNKSQKNFYTIFNGCTEITELNKTPYKVVSKISFSQYGEEAENSGIPLHKLDSQFERETKEIAKYIATLNGSYIQPEEKNERNFFSFSWLKNKNKKLKEL